MGWDAVVVGKGEFSRRTELNQLCARPVWPPIAEAFNVRQATGSSPSPQQKLNSGWM